MRRHVSVTALLSLLASVALVAQQGGGAQPAAPAPAPAPAPGPATASGAAAQGEGPQRPTFRAQIDYVEVSVIVTAEDGTLVKDLQASDFQVLEDGAPQTVTVFTPVNIPIEREARTLIEGKPLTYDVATNNRVRDGRVYVIVLDDHHIGALRSAQVKRAARQFIERYVSAQDQVAVIHTSGRTNASQEFTTNKALMLSAVDKLIGSKLRSSTLERLDDYRNRVQNSPGATEGQLVDRARDLADPERAYKARSSMETLRNTSRLLETINGSRKAVLFFSEGIDYDITDVMGNSSRFASDVLYSLRDAMGAATRSNVAYYAVDPRGLVATSDDEFDMSAPPQDVTLGLNPWNIRDEQRLAQQSLRSLAEETGGAASVNSNDFSTFYDRVVRDSSTYYLLGYYPTNERRDGRVRRIQVRMNRPGLEAYARKSYVAPKDKEDKRVEESASGTSPELRTALNSALPTPGLALSVNAVPFKGANKKTSVVVTVQVDGQRLTFKPQGDVFTNTLEISMMAMDQNAKIQNGDRALLDLKLRQPTRDLVMQAGMRSVLALDLAPGRYQLRVAAREGNDGAVGSVFTDLEVPDFAKEKFAMSGVLLTSTGAGLTPTPRIVEEYKALLPGPPTTIRGFSNVETISGYVDVYDAVTPAHTVDVATTITSTAGTKVFSTTQERKSSEIGTARGGYGVQFEASLKDFASGLYVLRVEATPRLNGVAPVARELTFAVFGPPEPSGSTAAVNQVVPIAHGPLSNQSSARESIARSADEWASLWTALPTKQQPPAVAFDQMMVVGVFLGNRPSGGFKVEITGIRQDADALVVSWREVAPTAGGPADTTVTTPFAVAGVPRHDGPVRFEKVGS
ncbi:MAG: VWA domain-containing protein [Acidobacteria bacterium]|nr:VWA domain-containing protein [Acidobacteriota bacterium]